MKWIQQLSFVMHVAMVTACSSGILQFQFHTIVPGIALFCDGVFSVVSHLTINKRGWLIKLSPLVTPSSAILLLLYDLHQSHSTNKFLSLAQLQ